MNTEERALLQREEARIAERFAALEAERDAARDEVERLRAERNGAYVALRDVLTAKPATLAGAASTAAKVIRNHNAERDRVLAERDRLAEQVKRVRELAAYFRDREANLKERYDQEQNDARSTALLSSAALTGDAAHRIERALDDEPTP